MVNVDVINYHVMLSTGNLHGELLTFCMAGTTFHRKCSPVSYFAIQRIPFNILWVYMFSSIPLVSEYEGKVNSCDVSMSNTRHIAENIKYPSF